MAPGRGIQPWKGTGALAEWWLSKCCVRVPPVATGSGFSHLLHSATAYGPPGQRSSDFREQQSKWVTGSLLHLSQQGLGQAFLVHSLRITCLRNGIHYSLICYLSHTGLNFNPHTSFLWGRGLPEWNTEFNKKWWQWVLPWPGEGEEKIEELGFPGHCSTFEDGWSLWKFRFLGHPWAMESESPAYGTWGWASGLSCCTVGAGGLFSWNKSNDTGQHLLSADCMRGHLSALLVIALVSPPHHPLRYCCWPPLQRHRG